MEAIRSVKIRKFPSLEERDDFLSVEEPLEISIGHFFESEWKVQNISITMRTPGNDCELAIGFLFTEGIVSVLSQIENIKQVSDNSILVSIHKGTHLDLNKLHRNFYTTSSCGVFGKSSLEAIRTVFPENRESGNAITIDGEKLKRLRRQLDAQQSDFEKTGGIHASALFDTNGDFLVAYEDVGRHNALDKLVGHHFLESKTNLSDRILLLSGRASFELIQKAASVRLKIVCAIGAPSSLAVDLAQEFNMTLIGFLKDSSFNIYSTPERVIF